MGVEMQAGGDSTVGWRKSVEGELASFYLFMKLISEEQVREEIRTKKSSFLSGIAQINSKQNNVFSKNVFP